MTSLNSFSSRGECFLGLHSFSVLLKWGTLLLASAMVLSASAQTVEATLSGIGGEPVVDPVSNKIYTTGGSSFIDGATNLTFPTATTLGILVAANPLTGKLYNVTSNAVEIIDETSNRVTDTIAIEGGPQSIVVNPATNTIYVTTYMMLPGGGSHGVIFSIDGADNSFTTQDVDGPLAGAVVNQVTNKIYFVEYDLTSFISYVIVLDGATSTTTKLDLGLGSSTYSLSLALNPVTNKIYAVSGLYAAVVIIDGASNRVSLVNTPNIYPRQMAVNPVTNKVYLIGVPAFFGVSGLLAVLDGRDNSVQVRVNFDIQPSHLVVNSVTNRVYVLHDQKSGEPPHDYTPGLVTVVDGVSDTQVNVVSFGGGAAYLAVNIANNKLYVGRSGYITIIDCGSRSGFNVLAGVDPVAVAINPVTNRVYTADSSGAAVRITDGYTNATIATVPVAMHPVALAANPVTNKVYVASSDSGTVTVIDGTSNTTTSIPVGSGPYSSAAPQSIALDTVSNKVYLANYAGKSVTIVDGLTGSTKIVPTGYGPFAIAVNSSTNKIYVANINGDSVTVIDGKTTLTKTVAVGSGPISLAVDPSTNIVYVANSGSGNITAINGLTNATSTIQVGLSPYSVAVNPVTHDIYTANFGDGTATLIDGATRSATTLATGTQPNAVAVNPLTNKAYVANTISRTVTAISGAATSAAVGRTFYAQKLSVPVGLPITSAPYALAVNPATNKVYTVVKGGGLFIVNIEHNSETPVRTVVNGVTDGKTVSTVNVFQTTNPAPSFTVRTTSSFTSTAPYLSISGAKNPPVIGVLYKVDGGGQWSFARVPGPKAANPANLALSLKAQAIGLHTLYVKPVYNVPGSRLGSPDAGNLTACAFQIDPAL